MRLTAGRLKKEKESQALITMRDSKKRKKKDRKCRGNTKLKTAELTE